MSDGPRRRPAPKPAARSRPGAPAARTAAARSRKAAARKGAAAASARPAGSARKPASRRPAGRAGRPAPRPGRRIAAGLVVSVVMVGFLLIGVFPTRTWLAQREETRERQAELDRIEAEQAVQEERIAELHDPDVIEHEAREKYGLAGAGETVYQLMPGSAPPVELPDTWPFVGADDWLNR
ncbi:MAG TPA: septum formation initiator family protein [Iamia sp.]|nr:septum formation initiator family protein [Iamia sp.]